MDTVANHNTVFGLLIHYAASGWGVLPQKSTYTFGHVI